MTMPEEIPTVVAPQGIHPLYTPGAVVLLGAVISNANNDESRPYANAPTYRG